MTKEEKELLMKDLCARLPYGVKCKASHGLGNTDKKHEYIGVLKFVGNCHGVIANYYEDIPHDTGLINNVFYDIEYIKPYLRPLSSITRDEKEEVEVLIFGEWYEQGTSKVDSEGWIEILPNYDVSGIYPEFCGDYIDWLNAHHFDYRGLIEKGLALEAPEDMYKIS